MIASMFKQSLNCMLKTASKVFYGWYACNVQNGLNGFLCETFNPKAYVDAIIQLCNEPLRQRMSKSAYAKSEIFSANKARKQMDIYSLRI